MKCLLLIMLFPFICLKMNASDSIYIDTIDFWKLELNHVEQLQHIESNDLVYSLEEISHKDTILIYYYTDTPCPFDCPSKIEFQNRQGEPIMILNKESSDNSAFILAGNDLILLTKENIDVRMYFTRKRHDDWSSMQYMGKLKFD